ncbi:hypothetical protein TVAG_058430 [Trichomonas vaginalis G3]|uniref:Cilium assembly protein DZIP1 N-terminal domain-containing protein n=1 Tax=Trichomonas vaginalis (strain ATCC PRA-98 / G3) TaxID=412133 RepID=A2EQA3_TRIV3|nr:zinc finger, C2H2-type family protein [Trichomonas vaginalis G3]EAY05186.1 hypothetical protein TVAG_058430 [Trichomonas vaginalis G3]KAI5522956.1 zinc finger, C2H2-type family protein [Trichomonas vaginalis G3]|eukprot:XP_001317409.1 hypothetical protein [Trichomonas vaginalis G3]
MYPTPGAPPPQYGYRPQMGMPPPGMQPPGMNPYGPPPVFQPPMLGRQPPQMNQPQMIPVFNMQMQGGALYQPSNQPPPPQIILTRPNPPKEQYAWAPRTEPMNWGLAESLDVNQMVQKGDLASVEFYMNKFTFANISKDDMKQFGSKGALNAFLILQLACDYLMAQRNMAPPPSTDEPDAKLLEQYNANIAQATKAIEQYKLKVKELQKQVERLKNDRATEKKIILKLKAKCGKLQESMKSRRFNKNNNMATTETEPGALKETLALQQLRKNEKKLGQLDSSEISSSLSEAIDTKDLNRETGEIVDDDSDEAQSSTGEFTGSEYEDEDEGEYGSINDSGAYDDGTGTVRSDDDDDSGGIYSEGEV